MSEVAVNNKCDCASTLNQVCDICQGLSKPWRKEVYPDGPWSYVWHGSGEDRGYTLKNGRETIAYIGDQIASEDMQDIAWAHNVGQDKLRALVEKWITDITPNHPIKAQCAIELLYILWNPNETPMVLASALQVPRNAMGW